MDANTYIKPNSNKYKTEQKEKETAPERHIEKVVGGKVTTKKKSGLNKLAGDFLAEDASSVKSYILSDVIVPAAKKLLSDIVKDGIEMILYGRVSERSGRDRDRHTVSYRKYYDDRRDDRGSRDRDTRTRFDFDEIIFDSRGDAEVVLRQMDADIEDYGFVTVAAMYDLAGLTQPWTSNKYGWSNLRSAEVVHVREGYIIKLPRPMAIDYK